MNVIEVAVPLLAFSFALTANGTNFDELEVDVLKHGGSAEKITNELVSIKLPTRPPIALPLGFTVVVNENGVATVLNQETFDLKYAVIGDEEPTYDSEKIELIDKLVERVEKLEKALADTVAKKSEKTEKVKDDKATGSATGADGSGAN